MLTTKPLWESPSRVVRTTGIICLTVGLMVMLGWLLDVEWLKSVIPRLTAMKFNNSLCLALLGAALTLLSFHPVKDWQKKLAISMGVAVMLIAFLTLLETPMKMNLGIDELVFRDTLARTAEADTPGRMRPNAAAALVLLSIALIVSQTSMGLRSIAPQVLAGVAGLISLVAVLGHLFSVASVTGATSHIEMHMHIHCAVALLLLAVGIIALQPERGIAAIMTSRYLGGLTARRMLPVILFVPVAWSIIRAVADNEGYFTAEFGLAMYSGISLFVFVAVLLSTAKTIDALDARRSVSEEEQRELLRRVKEQADTLELRVHQRTEELNRREVETRKLAMIVGRTYNAAVLMDPTWKIEWVNDAWVRIFEYPLDESVGQLACDLLIGDETDPQTVDHIREGLRSGRGFWTEVLAYSKSKRKTWIAAEVQPIKDERGRIVNFMAIITEITHRKEADAELRQKSQALRDSYNELETQSYELARRTKELELAVQAAQTANRSKSEFLANMSHEIRTPMTAILGFADMLLDPRINTAERLDCVQTIRRNAEHLLSIINDILDVSKIEAGKMTVEVIACPPHQVVSDVFSLLRSRASESGLRMVLQYKTPIPEIIQSDPTRVRQILTNLVGNAIKFTSSGEVRLEVAFVRSLTDSSRHVLQFDVIDTGIGMTDEQMERLFKPFSQADASTTRKFGGTGLGLLISRSLAKMLGGDINVSSIPGKGSTFSLTLMTGNVEGVRMIQSLDEIRPGNITDMSSTTGLPKQPLSGFRILLAEDGIDNRRLISFLLRGAGAELDAVENGVLAVEKAMANLEKGTPYDLVLMDMQMPELDGYGAASLLRSKGFYHPIIALTAHAMSGEREKCLHAGCDEHISKPINTALLFGTIVRLARIDTLTDSLMDNSPTQLIDSPSSSSSFGVHMPESASNVSSPQNDMLDDLSSRPTVVPLTGPIKSALASDPGFRDLVEQYVVAMPGFAERLETAYGGNDLKTLSTISHQLKGSAAMYGFQPITDAARTVEDMIRDNGTRDEIGVAVRSLCSLCRRATADPV